jgi:hypothetical protein
MIDSDIHNADSRLAVKFEKREVQNADRTQEEGRPIFEEKIFIKIVVPGDSLSEIDRQVYESDKNRFPIQWANFMNRIGDDASYSGTSLKEWPLITSTQAEELRGIKFHTVESIAMATDQSIQKLGMLAGMSPHTFRDKAKAFLKMAKEGADVAQREEEINKLKEENAKIREETNAKMLEMQTKFESQMTSLLAAVGQKRGRKPKVEE